MTKLTLNMLKEKEVVSIELKEDSYQEGHFILLIELKNAWVVYYTHSQCVFVLFKDHYPNEEKASVEIRTQMVSAFAKAPFNHYHEYSFVIQPNTYARVNNDLFVPLISNVIRYLDDEGKVSSQFKYLAEEFDCGVLLKEHELTLREMRKQDVLFVVNL